MASGPCCAAGAPLKHDYNGKGTVSTLADGTQMYLKANGPRAILIVHDIFGFKCNQVFQVADRLSDQGFSVAVPNVLGDDAWPPDKFPPADQSEFLKWVESVGDVGAASASLRMVRDHMQEQHGAEQIGVIGFCWGGGVSLDLASDPSFKGAACCHPAFFGKEKDLAQAAQVPVCILPAQGDPMEDAKAVLDQKPFGSKCFYQRFDDQQHGFVVSRGDYKDEKVAAAAGRAIELLVTFFDKLMPKA